MTLAPHDLTDLHLAPVTLALDARIEALAELSEDGLIQAVEGVTDDPIVFRTQREEALITAIVQSIDCHSWTATWDVRGLRLTHDGRSLVLGAPASFNHYVAAERAIVVSDT
jgi:hypothetical protein